MILQLEVVCLDKTSQNGCRPSIHEKSDKMALDKERARLLKMPPLNI